MTVVSSKRIMERSLLTSMEVSVIIFKEEGNIFAYCPSLNLISYGDTEEEAKESFRFIFDEYIQYTTENDTLIEDLLKTGWRFKGTRKKLTPPSIFESLRKNKDFSDIFNKYEFKKQNLPLAIPV